MSYILDALRKSESERRQGRVPDLGHQVQFVHKPGRKRRSAGSWIAIGLVLNAVVIGLALWFWLPDRGSQPTASMTRGSEQGPVIEESGTIERSEPAPVAENPEPVEAAETPMEPVSEPAPVPEPAAVSGGPAPIQEMPVIIRPGKDPEPFVDNEPTLIVPGEPAEQVSSDSGSSGRSDLPARVPHLVELPLSFQKSVPDLTFNSHVYSSQASSSRVMINGNYLSVGQSFSGIRVEKITDDGVVLSKDGRVFRVGVVRDWVSPR